jgi:hypothetical protein
MLFLALALPAIYTYAQPNLRHIAMPRWLDAISATITKSLASAKPQAEVSPVDPVAAAKVDEDLDYRIAKRTKSLEGWRAFLTAHPGGPHAQSARAELDELAAPVTPPATGAAQAPDRALSTPTAEQAPDRAPPETKVLARSFHHPRRPRGPKPRRLRPMRAAEATKSV